jgi:CheY-like chemotaxis protein
MSTFLLDKKPEGVFLFIDDDPDELFMLRSAVHDLGFTNEIIECHDAVEGLAYLKETTKNVCFILADIRMPKMDGLELKKKIEETPELKLKSVPFIYHSNGVNEDEILAAYKLNVQGYFVKAQTIQETKDMIRTIVAYWSNCVHPLVLQKID